jgi:hypothetical protein
MGDPLSGGLSVVKKMGDPSVGWGLKRSEENEDPSAGWGLKRSEEILSRPKGGILKHDLPLRPSSALNLSPFSSLSFLTFTH